MKTALAVLICAAFSCGIVFCQGQQTPPAQSGQSAQASSSSSSQGKPTDGKTRVYIADSESWQVEGQWASAGGNGAGSTKGGARPQTAEIIKTFNERCPDVTVTSNKDKANYAVILDHEGGKGVLAHRNKIAVFNRDGDVIFSDSTRSLGNSVKDACSAILKDSGPRTH